MEGTKKPPTNPKERQLSVEEQLKEANEKFKDALTANLDDGKLNSARRNEAARDNSDNSNGNNNIQLPPPSARSVDDSTKDSSAAFESSSQTTTNSAHNKDALAKINKFLKKQAKNFIRNFIDYGPPYNDAPFDPILVNACAKPVLNVFEVHNLLNARIDPNLPDPEDLYYTPLHWCARNAHVLGVKMLIRAGAKLELTNEMGIDALTFAVMIHFPRTKRNDQLKVVNYLLEKGASVNNRDKGGCCAIDYAAANQDLELIQLLLDNGANVLRENKILVAERQNILKYVHDPACYKLLYERLLFEESLAEKAKKKQQEVEQIQEEEKVHKKLFRDLAKRKERRMERDKNVTEARRAEELLIERKKKIQMEMEMNLQQVEKNRMTKGVWKRDTTGHWEFFKIKPFRLRNDVLYEESVKTMKELAAKNSEDEFVKKWESLSGGGRLEAEWIRSKPFLLPGEEIAKKPFSGVASGSGRALRSSAGASNSSKKAAVDVDFVDENDKELEGENLDDLLASLSNV
jgi:ankyrin repeat protein